MNSLIRSENIMFCEMETNCCSAIDSDSHRELCSPKLNLIGMCMFSLFRFFHNMYHEANFSPILKDLTGLSDDLVEPFFDESK
jgi:hypothetical protein